MTREASFVMLRSIIAAQYAEVKVGLTSEISMTIATGILVGLHYASVRLADINILMHPSLLSN